MVSPNELKDTVWLAKRLAVSVQMIERQRAAGNNGLPPFLRIGKKCVRYDETVVNQWLQQQLEEQCHAY